MSDFQEPANLADMLRARAKARGNAKRNRFELQVKTHAALTADAAAAIVSLMVRRRTCAVSNHEITPCCSSFETRQNGRSSG